MKNRALCILTFYTLATALSCSSPKLHRVEKNNLLELQAPGEQTARVVFIRPQKGMAGQGVVAIYDADALIGGLSAYSYFVYDARPGKHIFGCYSDPPNMDFLLADIDGGRTYYAQCSYQDRVLVLAGKFIAIKKNSDIMDALPTILPNLTHSALTEDGVNMFTVQQDEAGKYIADKRAPMKTYRIDIEGLRNNWLERAKVVQKPELLTEDGK